MKEISLHILDIAENALAAGATHVGIEIDVDHAKDRLLITLRDDGSGMDKGLAESVLSPFVTTRTTRKVGLGLPMFKAGADLCGGSFSLQSAPNAGTLVQAGYPISHIDRPPLGDIAETMQVLILAKPDVEFVFCCRVDGTAFVFDTREIRRYLGSAPIDAPEVAVWIREYIDEGVKKLYGGI
ncbi:MAG: sensor histidine kinase [Bacillota bacterium]